MQVFITLRVYGSKVVARDAVALDSGCILYVSFEPLCIILVAHLTCTDALIS